MFLLQRLTILLEESYEYGADVGGSRGLCCGLLEEVFSCDTSISFFTAVFFMNQCDVTSNNNVLTWRVNA